MPEASQQTSTSTGNIICTTNKYDIGLYIKKKPDNDIELLNVFNNILEPTKKTIFEPQIIGLKKRYFQLKWLERYSWLAYSDELKGAFCKVCCLFFRDFRVGYQESGLLVSKPYTHWKDAIKRFNCHSSSKYHKQVTLIAENFKYNQW